MAPYSNPFPPIPRPAVVPTWANTGADLLDIYPTETSFGHRQLKRLRPWDYCTTTPFVLIPNPRSYSPAIRAMVVAGVATADGVRAATGFNMSIEDSGIIADEISNNSSAYK